MPGQSHKVIYVKVAYSTKTHLLFSFWIFVNDNLSHCVYGCILNGKMNVFLFSFWAFVNKWTSFINMNSINACTFFFFGLSNLFLFFIDKTCFKCPLILWSMLLFILIFPKLI